VCLDATGNGELACHACPGPAECDD
jgi:hypothetical protein